VLRLFRLGYASLWGDEAFSLHSCEHLVTERLLGGKLNGILFFVGARLWIELGQIVLQAVPDWWLRLPSALAGTACVPLSFWAVRRLVGDRPALLVAGLTATGPFLIPQSQEFRFYPWFLLWSLAAMALFWERILGPEEDPQHQRVQWGAYIGVTVAGILTHYFFLLIPFYHAVALAIAGPRARRQWKGFALAAATTALLLLVIAWLEFRPKEYRGASLAPGGVGLMHLGWLPLSLFQFSLGPCTYPFDLALIIPAAALFAALVVAGLLPGGPLEGRRLLVFGWGVAPLLVAYIPLLPLYERHPLVPKYFVWAIPGLYTLLAAGVWRIGGGRAPMWGTLAGLAIAVNLASLPSYYARSYSQYLHGSPVGIREDLRAAVQLLAAEDLIVADAYQPFAPVWIRHYVGDRVPIYQMPRDEYRAGEKAGWPTVDLLAREKRRVLLLEYILPVRGPRWASRRKWLESWERHGRLRTLSRHHPLQLILYERGVPPPPRPAGSGVTWLRLPVQPDRLHFVDLRLPVEFEVGRQAVSAEGVYFLGPAGSDLPTELHLPVAGGEAGPVTVHLVGALVDDRLPRGAAVLEVTGEVSAGEPVTKVLSAGEELWYWDELGEAAASAACVLRWRHRSRLVGRSGYPKAWADFEAGMFHSSVGLGRVALEGVRLRYGADRGSLALLAVGVE